MTKSPTVSVIMPVYNEEKHIKKCIESLFLQDYPTDDMEWLFVDGMSTDRTLEILEAFRMQHPTLIRVLENPNKTAPYAMNIGIAASRGKYIIRLDAHAEYEADYFSRCIYHLQNTDADNVGGVAETKAEGFLGEAIAKMLSSKFGVGNSQFRTSSESGYVDTVPFGAFKREVFEKAGLFDTELIRSEDNDLNARIRAMGGKIWLAADIRFTYYCRSTVKEILKMALQNGNALFRTLKKNPSAMSVRHFIPFLFLLSLIFLPLISLLFSPLWYVFLAEMLLYAVLDTYFSVCGKNARYGIVLIWLYPLFHIFYGAGSLLGLLGIKLY